MLTLTAFIAFMLISPGFCCIAGIRTRSKYDLRIESGNATTQIIVLIVLAILVQLLTIPVYVGLLNTVFNIPFGDYYPATKDDLESSLLLEGHFNYQHWWILSGYIVSNYFLSFMLGRGLIARIENGCFKTSFFHGPLYEIIIKQPALIPCTVVTKISADGLSLMYSGHLRHITYEEKHKIKYVVLSHVDKFSLRLDEKEVVTSGTKTEVSHLKSKNEMEFLYIDGSEISNILFSDYPLKPPDAKELEVLKKALP